MTRPLHTEVFAQEKRKVHGHTRLVRECPHQLRVYKPKPENGPNVRQQKNRKSWGVCMQWTTAQP